MYCSKCGKEVPDGNAFCPWCGEKMGKKAEGAGIQPKKKKKKGKKWIWVIAVIFVIAGISRIISPPAESGTEAVKKEGENTAQLATTAPATTVAPMATTAPATKAATTAPATIKAAAPNATAAKSNGVDPELKAFLDSYEAFMDEYVEFIKKYKANPSDMTLLTKYADMMQKADDFSKKADSYNQDDMSPEDLKYYLDTMARIESKLLSVM